MHKNSQKKHLLTTALYVFMSCLASTSLQAQFIEKGILDEGLQHHMRAKEAARTQGEAFPLQIVDSLLDVRGYELWMDWYELLSGTEMQSNGRQCDAHLRINFTSRSTVTSVTFDAVDLEVDSVKVDNEQTEFDATTSTVTIYAPSELKRGVQYSVDIWYAPLQRRRGLYAFTAKEIDTSGTVPTNLVFTFSEPTDARYLFPCYDKPHDKALFTFHGRVPVSYTVVSNGLLVDSTADGDTASWQTWHCDVPMPTYLFTANASQFACLEQEVVSTDGRTIPIRNFYWPQDYDGVRYSAKKTFVNLPRMITTFENLFGRFPFNSYGHVTVAPIAIGGMEHQSMTTINRRWLQGDLEFAIAHELGHQWTGDQVTCGSWSDLWLNEGGAAWSEALWSAEVAGESGYVNQMLGRRATYLKSARFEPAVYDQAMATLFNEATTYCKAGWVYHMMYKMCGDAFLEALKAWFASGPTSRQTIEFREFLKQRIPSPPVSWNTFFDQWLLQPYHPVVGALVVSSRQTNSQTFQCTVTLAQLQQLDGFNTVFEFPLSVRLSNAGSSFDTSVVVKDRNQLFTVTLPFEPTACLLNTDNGVLMQDSVVVVTGVDDNGDTRKPQLIGSMPVDVGSTLRLFTCPGMSLTAFTTTGSVIASMECDSDLTIMPTNGWPSGLVNLVAEHSSGATVIPIILIK